MANIIEEYLVKLGFSTDVPGYDKFQKALNDAGSTVSNNTTGMIRHIAEFEVAAIGGFAAIGAAALNMANKAAMADQDYRLLALHMYTSMPVARELKVALDALGATLEDTMYDPELNRRFDELIELQDRIKLPEGFEANMEKIRDVRQEFINLYTIIDKYLVPAIMSSLVKIFGGDMNKLGDKLKQWTDYLVDHMPEISDMIANYISPVLKEAKGIMEELWEVTKGLALTFTQFVGMITGDKDLKSQTLSWHNFAKAVQEVAIAIGGTAKGLLKLTEDFIKLAQIALQVIGPLDEAEEKQLTWKQKAAAAAFGIPESLFIPGRRQAISDIWDEMKNPFKAEPVPLPDAPAGTPKPASALTPDVLKKMIRDTAESMGIDPDIAQAIAEQESTYRQFDPSGKVLQAGPKGGLGVMQVLQGTADLFNKQLIKQGKTPLNPNIAEQNIQLGLMNFQERLEANQGDVEMALRQYNQGTGREAYMSDAATDYAEKVMGRYEKIAGDTDNSINIQNLTVVSPDPNRAGENVMDELHKQQKAANQRNQSEASSTMVGYPQN